MSFDEHFKTFISINKSDACPDECECKGLSGIPAVWIPPPQKHPFVGIIISRDPTTAFIPYYTDAKAKDLSSWRELLFETNAIPRWTFQRITAFNGKYMDGAFSEEEMNTFRDKTVTSFSLFTCERYSRSDPKPSLNWFTIGNSNEIKRGVCHRYRKING